MVATDGTGNVGGGTVSGSTRCAFFLMEARLFWNQELTTLVSLCEKRHEPKRGKDGKDWRRSHIETFGKLRPFLK
jgi:hypothetical protein